MMKQIAEQTASKPRVICKTGKRERSMDGPRRASRTITPRARPICRNHTTCTGCRVSVRTLAITSQAANEKNPSAIRTMPRRFSELDGGGAWRKGAAIGEGMGCSVWGCRRDPSAAWRPSAMPTAPPNAPFHAAVLAAAFGGSTAWSGALCSLARRPARPRSSDR